MRCQRGYRRLEPTRGARLLNMGLNDYK